MEEHKEDSERAWGEDSPEYGQSFIAMKYSSAGVSAVKCVGASGGIGGSSPGDLGLGGASLGSGVGSREERRIAIASG